MPHANPQLRRFALLTALSGLCLLSFAIPLVADLSGEAARLLAPSIGAAVFAVVFVLDLRRLLRAGRRPDSAAVAGAPATRGNAPLLIVIAGLAWALDVVFWVLHFHGATLRFGVDPYLFAVPLLFYPLLLLALAREIRAARKATT